MTTENTLDYLVDRSRLFIFWIELDLFSKPISKVSSKIGKNLFTASAHVHQKQIASAHEIQKTCM